MEEINEISKQFLSCNSLKEIHLEKSIRDISWEEQKELLLKTVLHPLVLKYPLSYPFQRSFLRTVIHVLEGAGVDVHDDVYETYTSLLGASTTEYAYKHYLVKEQVIVTLKESSRLISDGTTGLHSWEAALVLGEWCLQNTDKLKDKCVVELGSGAGLTGLTVGKCCSPRTVWMTDCHPTVLGLLKDNLELNFANENQNVTTQQDDDERIVCRVDMDAGGEIGVMNVSWEGIPSSPGSLPLPWPQVLLAADVVYDSSLFPSLCMALSHFLHPPQTHVAPLSLLVCTVRNEDTFQEFIKMLGSYRIHHTELDIPTSVHFIMSSTADDPPVKILQLTPSLN